jgi:hypothetical protein
MNFGASKLYHHFPRWAVLYLACALQLVGAWLRMGFVWSGHFNFVLLGQALIFASGPITHNVISTFANVWFADNERATATALMILANPAGVISSFVI